MTWCSWLLSFSLFAAGINASFARERDSTRQVRTISFLQSYPKQAWHAMKAPARWQTDEWVLAGLAGATFFTLQQNDEAWLRIVEKQDGSVNLDWTASFGNGLVTIPALAILCLHGHSYGVKRSNDAAMAGLQAFVLSAGAAFALKQLTHRPRPDQLRNPGQWSGPFNDIEFSAFPSGHTMRAFAVATTIAGYYPERPVVGLVLYGLAGLTAVGRISGGEHWPSDVFAGAVLGYVLGRSIVHFNRKQSEALGNLQLLTNGNSIGLIWQLP